MFMKRDNTQLLREAIRLTLAEAIKVGTVRAALKMAKKKKSAEKAKAAAISAGKSAVGAMLDMIPMVATTKGALQTGMALADVYSATKDLNPKDKEKNEFWQTVSIDPDTSAIVDDAVEAKFLKDLGDNIENRQDDEDLPDADDMLSIWLKNKYSGAHVKK